MSPAAGYRDPDSQAGKIRAALLELIAEHRSELTLPTSARFLFYELVTREIISKHGTGKRRPDQNVCVYLTELREEGQIPWEDIADETRTLTQWQTAASVKEYVIGSIRRAKIDPWAGAAPMVICESRSLGGVLYDLAREFLVPIVPTNGQVGGFLHTDVGPALNEGGHILYMGDMDKGGADIEGNTRRVLERIVGPLEWEKLMLTEEQVKKYHLETMQKLDRRTGTTMSAIETESLSQKIIVQILRDRLEELLPVPLEEVHEQEQEQRAHILKLLGDDSQ